jgi:hypothetical protein
MLLVVLVLLTTKSAAGHAHLILSQSIIRIKFGEEYKL